MSNDGQLNLPRKKPSVIWWLGGVLLLLLLLFFLQLFGPSPSIIVSPQTTFISEPPGPDGLPDYEQYILDLYRKGVTPDNNAGVLLLKALWPGELQPSQYLAVVTELGIDEIPSREEALVHLHDKSNRQSVARWLRKQVDSREQEFAPSQTPDGTYDVPVDLEADAYAADPVINQAMSRPWTSEQIPPLAKWIAGNKKPLDLIVEASRRPRYYQPSPTLVNNQPDLMIEVLLPHVQSVREAGRALPARAMWHLGEGRPMEAGQDLLALHRLSRLIGQGRTLVEQLVAFAMSNIACDGTLTLLHHGELSVEQARQVMQDLAALEDFFSIADSLDQMERMLYLDSVIQFRSDPNGKTGVNAGNREPLAFLAYVSVDWNIVLRRGNQFYDRYVAAARLPTRRARETAISQIEADIMRFQGDFATPATLFSAAISPFGRGDAVASMLIGMLLPALGTTIDAQDRANTTLKLTRLAAALAVYRAEHGEYPTQLADLVPGALDALPVDIYTGKPFLYKRTDEGYLLYSAGENGVDDGGSSESFDTVEGRALQNSRDAESERRRAKIPAGADDIAIRVPRPAFKLPNLNPPTDEP